MHFFSPANVMKLLEVVRGEKTATDVLMTVMQLAKRIGKTAVVSGVCDGFIGNRMVEQYLRQAMFLRRGGRVAGSRSTRALEKFGMAMGPFRMSDLAGNDVGWRIRQRRYVEKPHVALFADRRPPVRARAASGRRPAPAGIAMRRAGATRCPIPPSTRSIAAYREGDRHRRRAGSPTDEIVDRCILALVNEGARILEEGIALRASDIDVVYLAGYGFPPWRGGPMLYADMTRPVQRDAPDARSSPRCRAPTPRSGRRRRCSRGSPPKAGRSTDERHLQMTDAVIVSTARTGLAKSWRGAFNMTHGATLGGHAVRHAVARAKLAPEEVDDVLIGCALPEGATGWNIARQIALRAGCPVTVPAATVNRFCSSGLQTIALAAQRIMPARPTRSSPAASSRSPACRTSRTST